MTAERAKSLILIFRQMREVVKDAIDNLEAIAENALMIFVDDETKQRIVPSSVAIENRLLNKTELAKRLGISTRTVSNLQDEGMPSVKLRARILFDYEKVSIWIEQREMGESRKNELRVVK